MQSPSRLRITFLMNASTCLITLPSMHTIPPYYEVSSVDTAAVLCFRCHLGGQMLEDVS